MRRLLPLTLGLLLSACATPPQPQIEREVTDLSEQVRLIRKDLAAVLGTDTAGPQTAAEIAVHTTEDVDKKIAGLSTRPEVASLFRTGV